MTFPQNNKTNGTILSLLMPFHLFNFVFVFVVKQLKVELPPELKTRTDFIQCESLKCLTIRRWLPISTNTKIAIIVIYAILNDDDMKQ